MDKTFCSKIIDLYISTALQKVMVNHKNNIIIANVVKYLETFQGAPYKFYILRQQPTTDGPPFWIENNKPPCSEYVYTKGLVCVGLANLARRFVGLEVPGHISDRQKDSFIGGTEAWFRYLMLTNRLEKIHISAIYPKGTLLLQDYNVKDQGHVAIVIYSSKKGLLYSTIIHSIYGYWDRKKYNSTVIEKIIQFPDYTRFTHICLPENWLLKN